MSVSSPQPPTEAQQPCAPETATRPGAARYHVKPREDGRGPYRWAPVVRTAKGLAMGTIYRPTGDPLTPEEAAQLRGLCDRHGFELRRVG